MNYSTSHNPAFVLKPRNDFAITILILVLIMMITLIPATMPNANGIQGNPSLPNIYPCGGATICNYDLNVNGTNYVIKYVAVGPLQGTNPDAIILNEIKLIPSSKSIMLNVTVAKGKPSGYPREVGFMSFYLPRSLIDARNSSNMEIPFAVFDNGRPLDYHIGCLQGCFLTGRIDETTDLEESFRSYKIDEDSSKFRAFSLGFEAGNHNIEMIGTTIAPEFPFPSMILISSGILMALVLATVRFARISRFPPQ